MRAVNQSDTCCFLWLMLTHAGLMVMDVWIGVCGGSVPWWAGAAQRGLYTSVVMVAYHVSRNDFRLVL